MSSPARTPLTVIVDLSLKTQGFVAGEPIGSGLVARWPRHPVAPLTARRSGWRQHRHPRQ
jgi:hypothetical protein